MLRDLDELELVDPDSAYDRAKCNGMPDTPRTRELQRRGDRPSDPDPPLTQKWKRLSRALDSVEAAAGIDLPVHRALREALDELIEARTDYLRSFKRRSE